MIPVFSNYPPAFSEEGFEAYLLPLNPLKREAVLIIRETYIII